MKFKDLSPEVKKIWKVAKIVQSFRGLTNGTALFIWGPLFYEKATSLSTPEVGILCTAILIGVANALISLLEIPTGALGDALGRRWSVIVSFGCSVVYYLLLAFVPFASSLTILLSLGIISSIAFALAYSFFSGSFTAWCVDQMREKDGSVGYEQIISRAYTYYYLMVAVGAAASILCYVWKIPSIPLLISSAFCIATLLFCIGEMKDEASVNYVDFSKVSLAEITKRMGEILGTGFQVFRKSKIILSFVLVFSFFMLSISIINCLWPVYLRSSVVEGLQVYYWPALAVLVLAMSSLGSFFMTMLSKRFYKEGKIVGGYEILLRRIFIATCFFSSLPILFLSYMTKFSDPPLWLFVCSILPIRFATGVITPCFETLINYYIPESHSKERATIMSMSSFISSLLILLLAVPSGGSSGAQTTIGWAFPAFLLLLASVVGSFILKKEQKKIPDVIGERVKPVSEI